MTRREFLATIGLAATASAAPMPPATEDSGHRPQRWASRLLFHPRFLAQLGANEVWRRDPRSLAVIETLPFPGAQGMGLLADGSLLVITPAPDGRLRQLHRVGNGSRSYGPAGAVSGSPPRILPAARADELYLASGRGGSLPRLRMVEPGQLWPYATLDVAADDQMTLLATGDDRLVYATAGAFVRAAPGAAAERWANPDGWVTHLAPGIDDAHLWYTQRSRLGLVALGTPVRVKVRHDLGKASIIHMHADAGLAAVLFVEGTAPQRWQVALFDDTRERWRADVPAPADVYDLFVAVSPTRVVVGGARELHGWDVATGKSLEASPPGE